MLTMESASNNGCRTRENAQSAKLKLIFLDEVYIKKVSFTSRIQLIKISKILWRNPSSVIQEQGRFNILIV